MPQNGDGDNLPLFYFERFVSGNEQGFDIEVSQVRCNFLLRDTDDIVIVGGSPPGSSYGSPTGNPSFNFNPIESGYGAPANAGNDFINPGSSYGAPEGFSNPNGGTAEIVDSYGSPVLTVDSIYYGSTQGSSFGRQPVHTPGSNPFLPSPPIVSALPDQQILVVGTSDSYGAPEGPIIAAFDPPRPNFEPEIITGRPSLIEDPIFFNPQLDGHRPNFNNPAADSYGAPQAPVQTSRPPYNPDPSLNNPARPDYNPGSSEIDSYGAPLAPVQTSRPPYNSDPTPRPDYNPGSDSYGAPQGPILTEKPTYLPTGRPHYRPRPGKSPNFLGPIASIIDAKRRAVANILRGFRSPKLIGNSGPRPSFSPPWPQFKLPFIDGFGKAKTNKRPRSRPSNNRPSTEYGPPQPRPTYQPSRPVYNSNNNNRPPRTASTEFSVDPRVTERKDYDTEVVYECGSSEIVPETFLREFVFRSPGYPSNYPDAFNCSVNIFPRKDVCALGLVLVSF